MSELRERIAHIRRRLDGASKRWEMTRDIKRGVKLWADGEKRVHCLSTIDSSRISDGEPDPLWLRDMRLLLHARKDIEYLLALLDESEPVAWKMTWGDYTEIWTDRERAELQVAHWRRQPDNKRVTLVPLYASPTTEDPR